ncbi:uncharacterized protein EV420DRAFT_473370 [Desarmillaria tabescens]|uniref:Uncharacterized protein n=1 Tax=Armillaria tabescens TaxID=1929756 RepID=A0AA39N4K2_ARMTA|nr:uncharacterized protein EV420DRAFT_473370 [Desarmillaria tabescens]KAK0457682.1 hypothetical protein EV420DRAFT_473370 [Desarmillaria tabescens]
MSLRSPLITRSSSAEGVRKLHQLYKTTFQQDVPIADKSNHLRVFLAICNTIGFEQDQLDHLRETFPSLSQVIWEDVASIANLDPAKGREQVKHAPVRFDVRLSMDLILRMKEDHCVALEIYKLPEWHTETAEHLHLTSYMIRGILALFGSLILSSAERIVPPRDTSSGGTIEVPLRLYNGLTLLVVEYEFRVLPQNRKQILAHLLAKLVAAAALNRQQGYTFNVHGMVTDLKETIWYTYNPRSGKFHVRGHVEIGGCNKTPEGLPVRESVAFMQKMALVTRFTLALLLEGYHDYLEETLAKYQLPPSVISLYLETLHLAEWDAHAYETYMRTKVSLPSDNTIVALTPRQRLIAVMHTYLSHLNFDLTSDSKPTRLVLQDGDGENVVGGTLWYTIPGLNTLRCALEASPYVVSDQPLNALNCYIRMDYVPSGETPFSNPVRIVSSLHTCAS